MCGWASTCLLYTSTILAYTDGGVPEVLVEVDDLSAYNVGYLIYFFWRACACSGYPVSYTHLDVYKRQASCNGIEMLPSGVAGVHQSHRVGAGVGRHHAAQLKHHQRSLAKGLAAGLFQVLGLLDVGVADHIAVSYTHLSIREDSVKMLLTIEIRQAGAAPKREQVAKPTGEGFVPGNGAPGVKGTPKGQPVRVIKIGRNDPCPCGSGLKWKKCTCAKFHPEGLPTDANED